MTLSKDTHICVLGGGKAGLSLIRELRRKKCPARITLIDRGRYFFDRKDLYSLLLTSRPAQLIDREAFCQEHKVSFLQREAERINYRKKVVYAKDKETVEADILAACWGLSSRDLDIRGDHREGFLYVSDIDIFSFRDYLSAARDVVIYASTAIGLRLAHSIAFLKKDIKLLTGDLSFLGDRKASLLASLAEKGIDIYEKTRIEEVVGENAVKAVKTSLPKVFSAHLVCVDSGLSTGSRLEEEGFTPRLGEILSPGVYMIGAACDLSAQEERLFSNYSDLAQAQGEALARILMDEPGAGSSWPEKTGESVDSFLASAFQEQARIS